MTTSTGQKLQVFNGNGDVSKWMKNNRVGKKTPTNHKIKNSKDALCQVWLKLAKWRRGFLNIYIFPLSIRYYLPLEKGLILHLNKLELPSPKDVFAKFGWNGPVVLEKIMKIWKVYGRMDRRTDRQSDYRRTEKLIEVS